MNTRQQHEASIKALGMPIMLDDIVNVRDTSTRILDGFQNVLNAIQASSTLRKRVQELQSGAHFHEASKASEQLAKADKIRGDLVKFWNAEMTMPAPKNQGTLGLFSAPEGLHK